MERKAIENGKIKAFCESIVRSSYLTSGEKMYELLNSIESYEIKDRILNHRFFHNRMTKEQNLEILKSYFTDPVVELRRDAKEQKLEDYYWNRICLDKTLTDPKVIFDDYGRKFTNILVEIYAVQKDTLVKIVTKYPKKFSPEGEEEIEELDVARKAIVHEWTDPLEQKITNTFFHGGIYRIQDCIVQKAWESNLIYDFSSEVLVGILKKLYTNEIKTQMLETAVAWGKLSLDDVKQVILTFDQSPLVLLKKELCESQSQCQLISNQVVQKQEETFFHLVDTYSVLLSIEEKEKDAVKNTFQAIVRPKSKLCGNRRVFEDRKNTTGAFVKTKK